MRPNAPTRRLRGADPLTVEVEVPGLVNQSLAMLAPGTLADLMALTELEDLAPAVAVRLKGYGDGVARLVADVPSGQAFLDWLEGVAALPAAEIPDSLRALVLAEGERRGGADKQKVDELMAQWAATPAEAFAYGEPRVAARKMEEGKRRAEPVRGRQARPATEPKKAKRAPSRKAAAADADPQQAAWVRQLVLERLSATAGAGLLEPVLLAAIKHRSRERFPGLSDIDVRTAIRKMANSGEIRISARRWKIAGH